MARQANKMPQTKTEWLEAFAEAIRLLHTESSLSTSDLHEVLDHIEDEVDKIRSVELLIIDDEDF